MGTILAKAPAIAKAADTLLAGANARKGNWAAANPLKGLTDRIAALEKHDQADADLLRQITDQVQGLTTASAVLAARLRWLLALGIVALAVAGLAMAVAIASRYSV